MGHSLFLLETIDRVQSFCIDALDSPLSAPEIHFYSFWRRYIVVIMDFDCYTGDRDLIPTHDDSLGK